MSKTFREYAPDQQFLLPPSLRDWLPEGHLALFVSDVVDSLDLAAIFASYEKGTGGGMPPYHPRLMTKVLFYGYCTGKASSRKIERATYEEVPFRVLAANQHPDHDSIASFRKRHLSALAALFLQLLKMAEEMGLVKLGHVSLDGTKVKANASKHKAMSYQRMCETEKRLQAEVASLLAGAEQADSDDDKKYGKGKRGDELPSELKRRTDRLKKIGEAKAALEEQAKERAKLEAAEVQARLDKRAAKEKATGKKVAGRVPQVPDPATAVPDPKAQRNFTDPESRIMPDGATKGFAQCYNAQAVVDDAHQIIIAADLTQQTNDKQQLVPMFEKVLENMGRLPEKASADCGYFSEAAVTHPSLAQVDLYVPPGRQKHGQEVPDAEEETIGEPKGEPKKLSAAEEMGRKLATPAGKAVYKMRKAIVEPVFGQIKQVRGFRQLLLRGFANGTAEWLLICAMHNLLKMFRSGRKLRLAAA
jgi:transposase